MGSTQATVAKKGFSTGAIIGIAIGCIAIVVIIIIIIVIVILKLKAGAKVAAVENNSEPEHDETDEGNRGTEHEDNLRESPRMENE